MMVRRREGGRSVVGLQIIRMVGVMMVCRDALDRVARAPRRGARPEIRIPDLPEAPIELLCHVRQQPVQLPPNVRILGDNVSRDAFATTREAATSARSPAPLHAVGEFPNAHSSAKVR